MTVPLPVLAWIGRISAIAMLLFLVTPLLVLIPIAFNDGTFFTLPRGELSLRWFRAVATDPGWGLAARNSVLIGLGAAAVSVVLGIGAAIALAYTRLRLTSALYYVLMLPLLMPVIVAALAMYIRYSAMGLTETKAGLIIAHATLGLPFVVVTVLASLRKFDVQHYRAALSLGANPLRAFWRVVLPAILPGVMAGAIYAFQASFDESIIVILLASPDQITLPRKIFAGITDSISPGVAVVSIASIAMSTVLLSLSMLIGRERKVERGAPE